MAGDAKTHGQGQGEAPKAGSGLPVHKRRPRYRGTHPRRFEEKYKEHNPDLDPDTFQKVVQSGKTPAGSHRPIMVAEVLEVLAPGPGQTGVDCTLGYGGHALAILERLRPGGRLIALDADSLQLPKTEERLRRLGWTETELVVRRTNFAGLATVLTDLEIPGVDFLFADLGVSSMQLDDPSRGFSYKFDGPLDMRMNPHKQLTASALLKTLDPARLEAVLRDNADEPHARELAQGLAGRDLPGTRSLSVAIDSILSRVAPSEREDSRRRVFQALRVAVNEEFTALEGLLRIAPAVLRAGARIAFLTFHSGEDRRVKAAFAEGLRTGLYSEACSEVRRPSPAEVGSNPRARPAKLRWAVRNVDDSGGRA